VQNEQNTAAVAAQRNKQRFNSVRLNRAKQMKINRELMNWLQENHEKIPEQQAVATAKFFERTRYCCANNLFRRHADNAVSYMGSHTCKHRCCMVCNSVRKKNVRKAFRRLFEAHPELHDEYDLMHVMLSVPHTEEGWQGQQMYSTELLGAFNILRKSKAWKRNCAGGVYNTEMTRNANGLHIHLHILAFVYKNPLINTRNAFYEELLESWNSRTVWEDSKRQAFSLRDIRGICKSLGVIKFNKETERQEFNHNRKKYARAQLKTLNPKGSTIIHVQNLYAWVGKKGGGVQKTHNLKTAEMKMRGVLECLKYHFKPIIFDKPASDHGEGGLDSEGGLNLPLISELVWRIGGKRLYGRFGILLSPKEPYSHFLKLMDTDEEPLVGEDEMNEVVRHPNTLAEQEAYTGHFRYTLERLKNIAVRLEKNVPKSITAMGEPVAVMGETLGEAISLMNKRTRETARQDDASNRAFSFVFNLKEELAKHELEGQYKRRKAKVDSFINKLTLNP
jgi:Replication protein